jgi:hypothetical protein
MKPPNIEDLLTERRQRDAHDAAARRRKERERGMSEVALRRQKEISSGSVVLDSAFKQKPAGPFGLFFSWLMRKLFS